jgi:hypothetical protein
MKKILIVSPPRSGSSVISQLLESAGYIYPRLPFFSSSYVGISPSEYNAGGYNEDVGLTLLNDQIIRILYGMSYSLLYAPSADRVAIATSVSLKQIAFENFFYDLDESSLLVPRDYLLRLRELANHEWDVWGLSRMSESGKWYRIYSRYNLAKGQDIYNGFRRFSSFLLNQSFPHNIYIKDPRFIFAFPGYLSALKESCFSVILINRESKSLLKSMRSHYGHRLFTDELIDNYSFVSNHFNFQVQPQAFSAYLDSVNNSLEILKASGIPSIDICYDKLMEEKSRDLEISRLENFLGDKVNSNILHTSF